MQRRELDAQALADEESGGSAGVEWLTRWAPRVSPARRLMPCGGGGTQLGLLYSRPGRVASRFRSMRQRVRSVPTATRCAAGYGGSETFPTAFSPCASRPPFAECASLGRLLRW
jgi:hypothetical protein